MNPVACCPAADLAHGVGAYARHAPNVSFGEGIDVRARLFSQRSFYGVLGSLTQIAQVNGVIHGPTDNRCRMNASRTNSGVLREAEKEEP
jgi:hypothetical protein